MLLVVLPGLPISVLLCLVLSFISYEMTVDSVGRLALPCTRQRPHVFDQTPNVIRCLKFAEARHPCGSDVVVDDPKHLLIRIALHSLTGEICGTWVHPLSRWRLGPTVDAVAYAAIQAEMCTPCFDTGSWGGGGSPWRLAKRMTERLDRFAMRVPRAHRS